MMNFWQADWYDLLANDQSAQEFVIYLQSSEFNKNVILGIFRDAINTDTPTNITAADNTVTIGGTGFNRNIKANPYNIVNSVLQAGSNIVLAPNSNTGKIAIHSVGSSGGYAETLYVDYIYDVYNYSPEERYPVKKLVFLNDVDFNDRELLKELRVNEPNNPVSWLPNLEEIEFSNQYSSYPYAFEDCQWLKAFTDRSSIGVSYNAFYNCRNLERVHYDRAYSIGQSAFYGCKKLRHFYTDVANFDVHYSNPKGIQYIADGAFAKSGIEDINFLDFAYIQQQGTNMWNALAGWYIFSECDNLTDVYIPIMRFPPYLFYGCKNLHSINTYNAEQNGFNGFYNGAVMLDNYCLAYLPSLRHLTLPAETNLIPSGNMTIFEGTRTEWISVCGVSMGNAQGETLWSAKWNLANAIYYHNQSNARLKFKDVVMVTD